MEITQLNDLLAVPQFDCLDNVRTRTHWWWIAFKPQLRAHYMRQQHRAFHRLSNN